MFEKLSLSTTLAEAAKKIGENIGAKVSFFEILAVFKSFYSLFLTCRSMLTAFVGKLTYAVSRANLGRICIEKLPC